MGGEDGVEVWRGCCNAWECDEMGHMNVRFYLARAQEGLVGVMAALGMENAFSPHAEATAIVADHHVRFLREARAGAPLVMRAGVLALGDVDARLLQLIVHARSGEIAASLQTVVRHATAREGRPFPWSRRARELAPALTVTAPERAGPRSLGLDPASGEAARARADSLDLPRIGAGAFTPAETDIFGRVRPDAMMGRLSDSVPSLPWSAARGAGTPRRVGGAVLEYRLAYFASARAGDRFEIRSGLVGVDAKTRRFVHWILDPASGAAWASAEAVAVALDLDERRIVDIDAAERARLEGECVAGLRF